MLMPVINELLRERARDALEALESLSSESCY